MRSVFPRLATGALTGAVLIGAALVGPLAGGALAHERRTVGSLQFVVGWSGEPAYAGSLNGVQITLRDGSAPGDPVPITDVGDGLKVEVSFGTDKVGPLDLHPVFNSPGEYRSPMIPSRAGVYTFRFVGTVKGQPVDQAFTSSDTTFDSPEEPSAIEFPVKDPSRAELGNRLERLDPRLASATRDADDAKSSAGLATGLAAVSLVVALAGVALAVIARRGAKA